MEGKAVLQLRRKINPIVFEEKYSSSKKLNLEKLIRLAKQLRKFDQKKMEDENSPQSGTLLTI